jgi:diguanylate cyclase (GGDEF)-like protein
VRAAERARSAISALHIRFEGKVLRVTASAGMAEIIGMEPGERAVARADAALYCSKKAGRNQGHYHDGESFKPFVPGMSEAENRVTEDRPAREEPLLRNATRGKGPESGDLTAAVRGAATQGTGGVWESAGEEQALPVDEGEWRTAQEDAVQTGVAGVWETSQEPEVSQASDKDPVTGLSTHAVFYEDLERRLEEYKRGGSPILVMMVQIDSWSRIVKKRGEDAGDFALKAIGRLLQASVRDMDHLARFDDDSFSMMLPTAGFEDGLAIARRLQQALARCQLTHGGQSLPLTTSIGLATAQFDDNAGRLLQRAIAAQNNAANRGGQRIYLHDGTRLQLAEWETTSV